MNVAAKKNFKKDFADILRDELESVGFDTSSIEDKDIPFKYFTVVLRTIEKKPRKIYKSATFTCPAELKTGLSMLENKITNGESLFPHQSKSVCNLTSEDCLLYSWSIHLSI